MPPLFLPPPSSVTLTPSLLFPMAPKVQTTTMLAKTSPETSSSMTASYLPQVDDASYLYRSVVAVTERYRWISQVTECCAQEYSSASPDDDFEAPPPPYHDLNSHNAIIVVPRKYQPVIYNAKVLPVLHVQHSLNGQISTQLSSFAEDFVLFPGTDDSDVCDAVFFDDISSSEASCTSDVTTGSSVESLSKTPSTLTSEDAPLSVCLPRPQVSTFNVEYPDPPQKAVNDWLDNLPFFSQTRVSDKMAFKLPREVVSTSGLSSIENPSAASLALVDSSDTFNHV